MAIACVTSMVAPTHRDAALIHEIQALLARDWTVQLLHTLREGNGSVDLLARLGAAQMERLVTLETPLAALFLLLQSDARRVPYLRD